MLLRLDLARATFLLLFLLYASIPFSFSAEKSAASLVNESEVLIGEHKYHSAQQLLSKALKRDPKIAEAHHNLGLVYARLSKNDLALLQFQQALNINPRLAQSWLMLASVQQASGNLKAAVESYDQFLKRFPESKLFEKITHLQSGLQIELSKLNNPSGYADKAIWRNEKMPITVFLNPVVPDNNSDNTSREQIIRSAFKDWQSASKGIVRFQFVRELKNADIECRWVSDVSQFENSAEAGQCEFFTGNNAETRCIIKLQPNPIGAVEVPVTGNRLKRTCLHEIGHALGLVYHSDSPDDIMFYSIVFKSRVRPSAVDIQRLKKIYTAGKLSAV